jgi:DNA-directed RNA polymerase beta subunit
MDNFYKLTAEYQKENKPWWKVAQAYFATHSLAEHQISSYNEFMRQRLSNIIENSDLKYTKDGFIYQITFQNVYVKPPEYTEPSGVTKKLNPQSCRIRNISYLCKIHCDIIRKTFDKEKIIETKVYNEVHVGAIPCMIFSDYCNLNQKDKYGRIKHGECPLDPGGYFILNGQEKVLMSQDRMAHNEIFVFKSKEKETIRLPVGGQEKNFTLPCGWSAEVRSYSSTCEPNITTTYLKLSEPQLDKGEDSRLYMEIHGLKAPVAWPIVFMALGVTDPDEMIRYVCDPDDIPMVTLLMPSLECPPINTQEEAIKYLSEYVLMGQKEQRIPNIKKILREKLFQNVEHIHMKRFYLGHMTHQLLSTVLGRRKEDDRDHYGKKRVETAGNLINNLFKSIWKRILRESSNNLIKKRTNDLSQIFFGKITNYILPPFLNGNWTATKTNPKTAKVGISQTLNRQNFISTVSNLRRVITPNDKNSKIIKPRHLHNSQWGFICPAECFDPNTNILMWDGSVKKAKNVIAGDVLMGSKGEHAIVKTTCAGKSDMYTIKSGQISYTVTPNHILTLGIKDYFKVNKETFTYFDKKELKYKTDNIYNINNILKDTEPHIVDIPLDVYLDLDNSIKDNLYGIRYMDDTMYPISVSPPQQGEFVGWQLTNNGRFLLANHTIVHNTPEGQTTGLIKNLAMLTSISLGSSEQDIITWLQLNSDLVIMTYDIDIKPENLEGKTKIFVNGTWVANTIQPQMLVEKLRRIKYEGKISYEVSISLCKEGVRIFTDEGRVMAPFFVVKKGKLIDLPTTFTWEELLQKGIIEYLDPSELETLKHAHSPWTVGENDTHSFIHPSFLLGISASTAPFSDHNQSPRNIYQSAMGKQALGVFSMNFMHRYDTSAHILCYPQKPLVNTSVMRLVGSEELPSGQNLIVAVMSGGYNQEDSVILNKRALDNGALRSICYTTYSDSNKRKANIIDEIKKPEKTTVKETRLKGYSKLDEDGISKENIPLTKNDVVIGKINSTIEMNKDTSTIVKTNGMEDDAVVDCEDQFKVYDGSAFVDKSILTINKDSFRTVKVRVRQFRIPQIGDKVASRSAQKGIIGMILPPEDMPFSAKTGITPDLIMNPNAFPSRMTMGQAMETFLGKACALNGAYADCTPFEPEFKKEYVAEELKRHGFEEYGDEVMINGVTGEQIQCKIFMGPTYYQRLKHMVADKIHSRNQDGPRETLTRQPVEGRRRNGGFRFGEMETWCGISHGATNFLLDRLVNNSDCYEMYVCNYCGNTAIATLSTKRFECKLCQQDNAISKIKIPYAFKLLMQELQACGIGVWFNIDTKKAITNG